MALRLLGLTAALLLTAIAPARAADGVVAHSSVADGAIVWTPDIAFTEATLDLTGPEGLSFQRGFAPGERIVFAPATLDRAPDGLYRYDLTFVTGAEPTADGTPALQGAQQSGTFEVSGGVAVESAAMMDFHATDGNIVGNVCIGTGCAGFAAYNGNEITLRSNNNRILFDDNSASTTLPDHDWGIIINDTFAGGREYFAVRDETNSRTVFTVEAGARVDALYIDNTSRIGIGERDPVEDLHMRTTDTPTIRLDQQGAFGDQAFDIGGNETNFFVRDVQANTLPIRLLDDTPTGMLGITADGVGIRTNDAIGNIDIQATLDVNGDALVRTDLEVTGSAAIRGDSLRVDAAMVVERVLVGYSDPSGVPALFDLAVDGSAAVGDLRVNGDSKFYGGAQYFGDITGRARLNFTGDYSALPFAFRIRDTSIGNANLVFVDNVGNMSLRGTLTQGSDRARKHSVVPVDPEAVLSGVVGMEVSTWQYSMNRSERVHLGPMAQDFHAAFGLGSDPTSIASIDADGVALASVQALHARSETDRARIAELEAELASSRTTQAALAARLARLEALLTQTPTSDD